MTDDFFADLVPIKPKSAAQSPEYSPLQARSPFDQDAVLVSGVEQSKAPYRGEVADLLGREVGEASAPVQPVQQAPMGPATSLKAQGQVKEFEEAVEATMRRFASGLQRILEDINRRLESLEGQTKRLSKAVLDSREGDALREGLLKDRFTALDTGLRDLNRGVQLVRDKQALLEAQAELAKLARQKSETPPVPAAPPPTPAEVPKASVPAESLPAEANAGKQTTAEPQQPEQPRPAAAFPAPTVPPMPAAPQPPVQPPPQQQPSPPQPPPAQPVASAPPQQPPQPQPPPPPLQYSASGSGQLPAQPQFSTSLPQQEQWQSQAQQAPQQPPAPVYPAQPPQPAAQYGPTSSQQYTAPPPPSKPFSAPQQGFQPYGSGRAGHYGTASPASQGPNYGAQSQNRVQTGYPSGYPNLTQSQPSLVNAPPPAHRYSSGGVPPPARNSGGSYSGPPPPRGADSYDDSRYGSGRGGRPQPPPSGQTASRNMPLEQVIEDVANMGFAPHDVRAVVGELMDRGQAVDLNVVLDRLMNGPRR